MITLMIFMPDRFLKLTGNSIPTVLGDAEAQLNLHEVQAKPLTYRPADNTVYWDGNHLPCGVLIDDSTTRTS